MNREPIDTRTPGTPIMDRRTPGEVFTGALVHFEQRARRAQPGEPAPLNSKGQPAQELVVHLITMQSTMHAKIGGKEAVPQPGDHVRIIFHGGGWGQWIDASKTVEGGPARGDVVTYTTTHAEFYNGKGPAVGKGTTEQQIMEALRARLTVGMRGDVTITAATDPAIVAQCKQAYAALQARLAGNDRDVIPAPPVNDAVYQGL